VLNTTLPTIWDAHIVTLEERVVKANLQWSLQPSLRAPFIEEIERLPKKRVSGLGKT